MFCKSCGFKIDDDSVFCSFCGVKQSGLNKPFINEKDRLAYGESETGDVTLSLGSEGSQEKQHSKIKPEISPKYDTTYRKETDATFFGVFVLFISLAIALLGPFIFDNEESYGQVKAVSSIGALFVRIIAIIWVMNIARRQNRETVGWGLLAFFLPSIALIIVGQLNKIYNPDEGHKPEMNDVDRMSDDSSDNVRLSKLPKPKLTIEDVIQHSTEQLVKYLKEYPESIWYRNYPGITPTYIFQELIKRGIHIDEGMQLGLEKFAKNQGYDTFEQMLNHYW